MINLKNINVILTGATGGIGNSILEVLVDAEANIVATGTNEEKLNKIKNKYQTVKVEKFDISEHRNIENFINRVSDKLGNKILYYHLMSENPFVPGFGKGNCKIPTLFGTNRQTHR